MPSISAISSTATLVGRAADGGGGVQRRGELEHAGAVGVVHDAGHVGGQVHHVGQVQHEGHLGHVRRGAVRRQRLGDRADGVLVLLEVLRRPRQLAGQRGIALVVTGTPDRAGQHPRGDQAALASYEQLGRGAEEPVDVEGPAHLVVVGQLAQRPAHVDVGVGRGHQVAGEHDLLQLAGADPADRVGDDGLPGGAAHRAVGEGDVARRGRARLRLEVGQPGQLVLADDRDPRAPAPGADHHAGHHQDAVARVVGEAEAAEADQAGAGDLHLVADHGARGDLLPPVGGVGEPVGPRRPAAGGDAPGDHALAAAQPGHRLVGGEQVEQARRERVGGRPPRPCGPRVGRTGASVLARGLVTTKEPTW